MNDEFWNMINEHAEELEKAGNTLDLDYKPRVKPSKTKSKTTKKAIKNLIKDVENVFINKYG